MSNTTKTISNITNLNILTPIQLWLESSKLGYLIVFIAGALLALAFSPIDFYLIAVLSPAILFYSLMYATQNVQPG